MLLTVAIVTTLVWQAAAWQAPREQLAPQSGGRLTGSVLVAGGRAQPLARAEITLTSERPGTVRYTRTDDSGVFRFGNVPPGRYTLSAAKAGYLTTRYGAVRPLGTGTPVVVVDGSDVTGLNILLLPGAAISGTVRDRGGQPVAGARVTVLRWGFDRGQRVVSAASNLASAISDGAGLYRVHSLPPGGYLVSVAARYANSATRDIEVMTADDVARASAVLSGTSIPSTVLRTPVKVAYPEAYYPGTDSVADAITVKLAAGDDRGGVDIAVAPRSTVTLTGVLHDPQGSSVGAGVRFWVRPAERLVRDARSLDSGIAPNGVFTIRDLFPGRYVLQARATLGAKGPVGATAPPTHWARLEVAATGESASGLAMTLQPTVVVEGRVNFERDDPALPLPDSPSVRISLAEAGETRFYEFPSATVSPDGTFAISGLAPTRYRLSAQPPAGWILKSALTGGSTDYADAPLEVPADGKLPPLVITYTSRRTVLSGVLQDEAARPAGAFTVVVFSADRTYWTPYTRRVQSARPGSDGSFVFRDLPAGAYLLGAVTDVEDGQALDPAWLTELVPFATTVTVTDGGTTVRNIQIRKAPANPNSNRSIDR